MDKLTASFYTNNAETIFERYESVESNVVQYIQSSFLSGACILDIGAGSGRDLRKLLSLGYDAYGAEPCDELRTKALLKSPELNSRFFSGTLPGLESNMTYDGILCSAVFMHIPESEHLDALINIRALLTPNGRLLISIPNARPDLDQQQRDQQGRLFEHIAPDKLKLLCARLGLECIAEYNNEDSLGRTAHDWVTLLFQKRMALGRPLDRIETVLRNDKKTATYKLALLRAFCDLAEQDENGLDWRANKQVALPLRRIAECWLLYYWPLIASPQLLPQNNSIASGGRPMAFRQPLEKLIQLAQQHYKADRDSLFSLFILNWKKGTLPVELTKQLQQCLQKIQAIIVSGPIQYAEQGQMFGYEARSKSVLIDAELWTELCLTGYWIKDSLLLRWAELSEQFSRKHLPTVTKGLVLDVLMTVPNVGREQLLARKHYLNLAALKCVWTDKKITSNTLAVDHALPYSLWHNNQLWNLLPAHKTINLQKSDHIPSPALLKKRRDAIVYSWDYLHDNESAIFQYEVERTLGLFNPDKWHGQLFNHMKSKAEQGIYSRGALEWIAVNQ